MRALTSIHLNDLCYGFSEQPVLNHLSLDIEAGGIVALLGPSGCGKSTLLKLIAGLLQPQQGEIRFGQQIVASRGFSLPPEQRNLGMVFQDYALWPHMTVGENIAFPLAMRKVSAVERRQRVTDTLARVGLDDFTHRRPAELSGGQQQRVALARAIVAEPAILLFDEPLSNLDSALRDSLCREMAQLLRQLGATAIYVTHDQREAELLADRIVHLSSGAVSTIQSVHTVSHFPGESA